MHTNQHITPLTEQAPWLPLEDVIEQWAAFAHQATTPFLSKAVSAAFTAFSCEQEALASYQGAVREGPACLVRSSLLSSYDLALDELQQGVDAWTTVASLLAQAARAQRDPAGASTLCALVIEALTHCQRLHCIAYVVRAEQQRCYQQHYQEAQPHE